VSQYEGFLGSSAINIKDYKVKAWKRLPPDEQDEWVEEVFDYYRNTHGFPYQVLTDEGIHKDLWKLRRKPARIDGVRIPWDSTASTVTSHYFPHVWSVPFRNKSTAYEAYESDKWLRSSIRLCFKFKPSVSPADLLGAFCLGGGTNVGVVSRFKPMAARTIYERYAPEDGVVYDYACGWGGRMMGAIASPKRLTYYGVDPEPRTFACLESLRDKLFETYREPCRAHIYKMGSEDYCPDELRGKVDVAFSSPPYFDLEKYSDDPTQSHVKFPTVDGWLDGFLLKTFQNIHALLKPGGVLALNLTDAEKASIVPGAKERILSLGFEEIETLQIEMVQRRGQGNDNTQAFKYEPVYAYRKV
jgi:SAM-dependent methyltransferase